MRWIQCGCVVVFAGLLAMTAYAEDRKETSQRVLGGVHGVVAGLHGVNDRAGGQEQQRLEEGVCHQVEHAGRVAAQADRRQSVLPDLIPQRPAQY